LCIGEPRATISFANFAITSLNRICPIALRFRDAVRHTVDSLREHPLVGARYRSTKPELQKLRSWPVAGFEVIRIYYHAETDAIHVIRILHGKRDVKRTLEGGG
jgi:plasmid stabilization system protein ParE